MLKGGGGGLSNPLLVVTVNSKEETLNTFVPITSKNSAAVSISVKWGEGRCTIVHFCEVPTVWILDIARGKVVLGDDYDKHSPGSEAVRHTAQVKSSLSDTCGNCVVPATKRIREKHRTGRICTPF